MNFIWDLDGTLLDSYPIIVDSIYDMLRDNDLEYSKEYILDYSKRKSVADFFVEIEKEFDIDIHVMKSIHKEKNDARESDLKLMPGAANVLKELNSRGHKHYMYTHKGSRTIPVLKNLGIKDYFIEVVNSENGFARKPDPEGNEYLIRKYNLPLEETYYIGDRSLDIESADNAKITGIHFGKPTKKFSDKTIIINCLEDLLDIF